MPSGTKRDGGEKVRPSSLICEESLVPSRHLCGLASLGRCHQFKTWAGGRREGKKRSDEGGESLLSTGEIF